jgi:hypothetical protein
MTGLAVCAWAWQKRETAHGVWLPPRMPAHAVPRPGCQGVAPGECSPLG